MIARLKQGSRKVGKYSSLKELCRKKAERVAKELDFPEVELPPFEEVDLSGLDLPERAEAGKPSMPVYDSRQKLDGGATGEPVTIRNRLDGLTVQEVTGRIRRDRSRLPLPAQFPFPFDLAEAEAAEAAGRLAEYEAECEAACPGVESWCSRYPKCDGCRWHLPEKLLFCKSWNCLRYDSEEVDVKPTPDGRFLLVPRQDRQQGSRL